MGKRRLGNVAREICLRTSPFSAPPKASATLRTWIGNAAETPPTVELQYANWTVKSLGNVDYPVAFLRKFATRVEFKW
jgi:hypothetical protein